MSEKKEYIERGALIGAIEATEFLTMQDAATTLQLVTEAPAADVDPIVRCKKCRYWEVIGTDEDEGFCKFRAGYTAESYYCADGKERWR